MYQAKEITSFLSDKSWGKQKTEPMASRRQWPAFQELERVIQSGVQFSLMSNKNDKREREGREEVHM